MDLVKLETDKERHYIAKNLIGHYSVTFKKCEMCGMEHSVLDIYDRRGCLICSLKDTKDKIEQLCSDIEQGDGKPEAGNLGDGDPEDGNQEDGNQEDGNQEDGNQEDVKPANNKEAETKADDVKKTQQDRKDNE